MTMQTVNIYPEGPVLPETEDGSKGDDWATPDDLWEEIKQVYFPFRAMDNIVDPCPGNAPLKSVKNLYTFPEDAPPNGDEWFKQCDFIYANPPFSDILPWVKAGYEFAALGGYAVYLLPKRTDRPWWRVANKGQQVDISDRVQYVDPVTRKPAGAVSFPSSLVIFRPYNPPPVAPELWWPECHKARALKGKRGEWHEIAKAMQS